MLKKKIMAYVHQLLDQPSQWQTSQQAGPCSVPKFTSTSFTVKHLLIKNQNINQSKSSLLIWHYVSYLFLFRFLPYMGTWPSWSCDQDLLSKLCSLFPQKLHINLTLTGPVVSEEKMFKECGWWRTMEAYLSYKLTKWAFCSGELTTKVQISLHILAVRSAPLLFAA